MTWEETILMIRQKPEYADLVRYAYFDPDLSRNVERFRTDGEYAETLRIIREYKPDAKHIVDIGAGNGIASVAFALDGYRVTAVEPDESAAVGANAINWLKNHYKLPDLEIIGITAEHLPLADNTVDVVYARQAMHHAHDLNTFVAQAARVLKNGGLFITVRDHVTNTPQEKQQFLRNHPLQQYYHGENAFSLAEYKEAIQLAGLQIKEILSHYQSPINYFPATTESLMQEKKEYDQNLEKGLREKIGILSQSNTVFKLYREYISRRYGRIQDESLMPGRLYSFVALKP